MYPKEQKGFLVYAFWFGVKMDRGLLLTLFVVGFIIPPRSASDLALKLSRVQPYLVSFDERSARAALSPQAGLSLSAWVRVLEGRASSILSPFLDIVETDLGLRLRGCANLPEGIGWACVTGKGLWRDDGDWHHIAVSVQQQPGGDTRTASFRLALIVDGEDIGVPSRIPHANVAVARDARPRPVSHYASPPTDRVWAGLDINASAFPLTGALRDIHWQVGDPEEPSTYATTMDCGAAGRGSTILHWRLSGTLDEACGGLPLKLLTVIDGGDDDSLLFNDGSPPRQVTSTIPLADVEGSLLWTALPPSWRGDSAVARAAAAAKEPLAAEREVPSAGGASITSGVKGGYNVDNQDGSRVHYSVETLVAEAGHRVPKDLVAAFRASTLIFASEPDVPRQSSSDDRAAAPEPYYVIYYSASPMWDMYWRLYHDWLVHVILRDVRRVWPVRVLLDRCGLSEKSPGGVVGISVDGSEKGMGSCRVRDLLMMNDSLVVINAHQNPHIHPLHAYSTLLLERGVTRNVALLHQNHEQPRRVGMYEQAGTTERPDDWRNGYPGGLSALAAAYQAPPWAFVRRQYFFEPLGALIGKPESRSASGQLDAAGRGFGYVPVGPSYAQYLEHGHVTVDKAGRGPWRNAGLEERRSILREARVPSSQRSDLCFFAGTANQFGGTPDREHMLRILGQNGGTDENGHPRCSVVLTTPPTELENPSKQELSHEDFLARMRRSVFAPAPSGNNPETFRHWEAIEMGAIPVSVPPPADISFLRLWCDGRFGVEGQPNSYAIQLPETNMSYVLASRSCPIVLLGSWDALPGFLDEYQSEGASKKSLQNSRVVTRSNPKVIDQMQAGMLQWLEAAKLRISREFAASLVGSEVGSSSKKKGKSKKHPASAAAQGKGN